MKSAKQLLGKNAQCPCCSAQIFSACCYPLLSGTQLAETAVQLMRSRYTAYSLADITYIQKTMSGPAAEGFDAAQAKQWAELVKWCGLTILDAGSQNKQAEEDQVEFAAKYVMNNLLHVLHERSQFKKINSQWFYFSGAITPHQPIIY